MYSGMNFLPFFINCEEHGDAEEFQKGYNEEVSQEGDVWRLNDEFLCVAGFHRWQAWGWV